MQIAIQQGHSTFGSFKAHLSPYGLALTFHYRYVDLYKAYAAILANTFKMLYNISARRRAERDAPEVKAVLDKSSRTDVQQDESLLTRIERETLKEWEAKQLRLTVIENRVEELVFIMRDLAVHGIEED